MKKRKLLFSMMMMGMLLLSSTMNTYAEDDVDSDDYSAYTTNNDVTFTAGGGEVTPPVNPIDLEEEDELDDKEKETGYSGSLRLDVVPSFSFGTQKITTGDKVLEAVLPVSQRTLTEIPYYVQMTDVRGSDDGFELSAKMTSQFKNTTNGKDLTGAYIAVSNLEAVGVDGIVPPSVKSGGNIEYDETLGTSLKLATASDDQGMGVSVVRFGDLSNAQDSVYLVIPASTNVYKGTYESTILWTLSSVPTEDAGN